MSTLYELTPVKDPNYNHFSQPNVIPNTTVRIPNINSNVHSHLSVGKPRSPAAKARRRERKRQRKIEIRKLERNARIERTIAERNAGLLPQPSKKRRQRRRRNMRDGAPQYVPKVVGGYAFSSSTPKQALAPVRQLRAGKHGPTKVANALNNSRPVLKGNGSYSVEPIKLKEKKPKNKEWWEKLLDVGTHMLPHVLPLLMGAGDYTIKDEVPPELNSIAAAATDGKLGAQVPAMHTSKTAVRIAHREYLGDVYSSTAAFTPLTFTINPGLATTFPWLSVIAANFQTYRFLGLCFEFISEGSEYANVAGLGYVALATQYNSLEGGFLDKRTMLNYDYSVATKPSNSMIHCVECKPSLLVADTLYVRQGSVPVGADERLYDLGQTTLAVGGNTASNSVIGEVWVSYDIELNIPKESAASGTSNLFFEYGLNTGGPNFTNSTPLATNGTLNPNGHLRRAVEDYDLDRWEVEA